MWQPAKLGCYEGKRKREKYLTSSCVSKSIERDGDVLTADQVMKLLDRLCIRLGFCLPPDAKQRLMREPPEDVSFFTDAVFREEGLDPELADRHLYRQVRDVVRGAFEEAERP